jgi:hypothetical protein
MATDNINHISERLLLAVKMQQPTDVLITELRNIQLSQIQYGMKNDDLKKAFWINIYNSFYQILRKVNRLEKPKIFTHKIIFIANTKWSLDDIEHGILRRFRYKFTLGFFPKLFVSDMIKKHAVSKIDYRIHFALNCGAKSCPPIAFYTADNIEQQLETATLSFLDNETNYLEEKKEVHISRLFLWFLSDFGGKKGIRNILKEKLHLNTNGFKLVFKKYSWEEQLDNYDENTFIH